MKICSVRSGDVSLVDVSDIFYLFCSGRGNPRRQEGGGSFFIENPGGGGGPGGAEGPGGLRNFFWGGGLNIFSEKGKGYQNRAPSLLEPRVFF